MPAPRDLVVVLGDQLDIDAAAFDDFDPARDAVWMAEVAEESTHVWSSKQRIALFLASMRHFAEALRAAGRPLHYVRLDDAGNRGSLAPARARRGRRARDHDPQGEYVRRWVAEFGTAAYPAPIVDERPAPRGSQGALVWPAQDHRGAL